MRLLILGGTGPSGIALIRKALEVYPDGTVVAYARSPEKIPEDLQNNASVVIVKGTLEELDLVEQALEGVDVVVSALGPLTNQPTGNPIATFYGHLIDLLYKHKITRFLPLATASHPDPHDKTSWKYTALIAGVRTFARNAYSEIRAIGQVVTTKGKDLEYTIVRVPILTNAETEGVAAGYVGDGEIGVFLARKAYAAFCIAEIEKKEWVKTAPLISNVA
ncbi:unnamed protein product [Cyclocybe aegerita]|uniref:NAD(P)-binding domain-containing protein n=1 Tax=Cyclocybe aegerita TaxID=1973307 RepID=A0A8S0VUA1_CYCAE|nr:unnamed protein product [Cyclocybe aegerita]